MSRDSLYPISLRRRGIYQRALSTWGYDKQLLMVMEECGELLNALAKESRGRCRVSDIITELADVSIMVEQMAQFFGWDEFEKERERKLKRVEERLDNYREGQV